MTGHRRRGLELGGFRGGHDDVACELGAGTGFRARAFAPTARHGFGVGPYGGSRLIAHDPSARMGWENVSVLAGSPEPPRGQRIQNTSGHQGCGPRTTAPARS